MVNSSEKCNRDRHGRRRRESTQQSFLFAVTLRIRLQISARAKEEFTGSTLLIVEFSSLVLGSAPFVKTKI